MLILKTEICPPWASFDVGNTNKTIIEFDNLAEYWTDILPVLFCKEEEE